MPNLFELHLRTPLAIIVVAAILLVVGIFGVAVGFLQGDTLLSVLGIISAIIALLIAFLAANMVVKVGRL